MVFLQLFFCSFLNVPAYDHLFFSFILQYDLMDLFKVEAEV
jgi:hypothetical protein